MIRRRRGEGGESLAFLDIITCGFGAMILLLIISKPVPDETDFAVQQRDLSAAVERGAETVATLQQKLQGLQSELSSVPDPAQQSVDLQLETSVETAKIALQELKSTNQALELVKKTQFSANITQTTAPTQRDPEVGGIPVDGEYVIFIIDTSGSMIQIWDKVVERVNQIIDIHPQVRGFQIMNDNGFYLLPSTQRKWLPDTPRSRENVKNMMYTWADFSSSSPVEGLVVALRDYGRTRQNISIYIVGDDFTGASYDEVIQTLRSLNTNRSTGRSQVRVHSLGFISQHGSSRYSTLMRSVAEQNRGAFLGLPH